MANNLSQSSFRTDIAGDASNYFNNMFVTVPDITSNINDAVISFFEKVTGNTASAQIMASALIYTAQAQQMDPMMILDQMRGMSDKEKNNFLNMYLNLNRVGTSYLGSRSERKNNRFLDRMLNPPEFVFDGSSPERAAASAYAIKEITKTNQSQYYWIRGCNNEPMFVYCDMTGAEAGSSTGGWMRFDNVMFSQYSNTAIIYKTSGYGLRQNGRFNTEFNKDSLLRGIRWDLGASIKFSGVRITNVYLQNIGGQDGWAFADAPTPGWIEGKPTNEQIADFYQTEYILPGVPGNHTSFGWAVGNGGSSSSSLKRLYSQAPEEEWEAQYIGYITLTQNSFIPFDSGAVDKGRYLYYFESDGLGEYNNLLEYTVWLR